ncbi:SNF2 family N-terminal domain-containing protein [Phellopilus nigrolimitatus]|nr:SNF2 family N-terminal domain-containing protein [Phellopilus nigrolimitatus]
MQPQKKRKISQIHSPPVVRRSEYYLGSLLVSNAWSTVRGTGYVKNGDPILVERDDLQEESSVNRDAKKKGKAKQMAISSMFKPQAKSGPVKKSKANTIVRLTNARGFEFGRLPTDVSNWISKLLDFDIITFKGSTMIDCPEKLHSGADLLVSLSIYILPTAFKPYTSSPACSSISVSLKTWFNEGAETTEEETLRNRKLSLHLLFNKLGLEPRAGNNGFLDKENVPPDGTPPLKTLGGTRSKKGLDNVEGSELEEVEQDENDEELLDEGDIDVIYKRAQANDAQMGEMDPCKSFSLQLRSYQKQALLWMYSRETGVASARQSKSIHPLWAEYAFPPEPDSNGLIDLTAEDQPFYYNSHSGELSLDFPRSENVCRGGILAADFTLGMGKTIMVSSLIQTNRGEKLEEEVPFNSEEIQQRAKHKQLKLDAAFRPTMKKQATRRSRATLIVAPASLLDQWATELRRSSIKGTVNVSVWHGQGRDDLEAMIDSDVDAIDIIITSFGTLASEHARLEKSNKPVPIFDIEWFRVVLDEAHNIKSRTSKTARAAFDLKAPRRWALTGTPIVNRLDDLYSLLRFLNFAPWSDYSFFRTVVTLPFLGREPKAVEVVQVILESVLLRREKTMRDRDGNMIVQLPSKQITHEYLEFSPLERRIYDDLFSNAKLDFDKLNAKGLVGKKYTHILAMLMKLRRAVLHPSLVLNEEEDSDGPSSGPGDGRVDVNEMIKQFSKGEEERGDNNVFAQSVLNNLALDADLECPICMDIMEQPMLIPICTHKCCKDCVLAFLHDRTEKGEEGHCPTCRRGPLKEGDLLEIVKRKKHRGPSIGIAPEVQTDDDLFDENPSSSPGIELRRNDFKSSTKLNALVQHLRRLRDQDPCFRVVIFSQFTSFLSLIEVVLQREKLAWYRLDGSTEIKKRQQVIAEFNAPSRKPKVFMLSLKAGGVGLNLTSANHVFMMDCWWNAATEQQGQSIDRVHRIGQEKTVFVTHFIVSNTIEGRILTIQKRKTAIIKEAFKGQSGADSESMENLKIMFGED